MTDDPIVDEVRKHRQENAAKFNYDVRAIAADAIKRECKSGHRVVNLEEQNKRRATKAGKRIGGKAGK